MILSRLIFDSMAPTAQRRGSLGCYLRCHMSWPWIGLEIVLRESEWVARHPISIALGPKFLLPSWPCSQDPPPPRHTVCADSTNMASTTGSDVEKAPAYTADEKGVSQAESSNGDVAVGQVGAVANFEEVGELRQGLQQRHIQMIALAGAIGTVSVVFWC